MDPVLLRPEYLGGTRRGDRAIAGGRAQPGTDHLRTVGANRRGDDIARTPEPRKDQLLFRGLRGIWWTAGFRSGDRPGREADRRPIWQRSPLDPARQRRARCPEISARDRSVVATHAECAEPAHESRRRRVVPVVVV